MSKDQFTGGIVSCKRSTTKPIIYTATYKARCPVTNFREMGEGTSKDSTHAETLARMDAFTILERRIAKFIAKR